MDAEGSQTTTIDLEPGSEWRFELENDEDIAVRVSHDIPHTLLAPYARDPEEAHTRESYVYISWSLFGR